MPEQQQPQPQQVDAIDDERSPLGAHDVPPVIPDAAAKLEAHEQRQQGKLAASGKRDAPGQSGSADERDAKEKEEEDGDGNSDEATPAAEAPATREHLGSAQVSHLDATVLIDGVNVGDVTAAGVIAVCPFVRAMFQCQQVHRWATPSFIPDLTLPGPLDSELSISVDAFGSHLDNTGLLGDVARRAAKLLGADGCYFTTSGTTCSNHKVMLTIKTLFPDAPVVSYRGVHHSITHSSKMYGVNLVFAKSGGYVPEFEALLPPGPADIAEALDENPKAKVVLITSPTYEGVIADVAGIAKVTRERGVILWVDQAWGSHLGLARCVPDSALHLGADIVCQSTHKTGGAMQGAGLLLYRKQHPLLRDPSFESALQEAHQEEETTSPNFRIIASIDAAVCRLVTEPSLLDAVVVRIDRLKECLGESFTVEPSRAHVQAKAAAPPPSDDSDDPDHVIAPTAGGDAHFLRAPMQQHKQQQQQHKKQHGGGESTAIALLTPDHPALTERNLKLDPARLQIRLPPGVPGHAVAAHLERHGIVVEKAGLQTVLVISTFQLPEHAATRLCRALKRYLTTLDQKGNRDDGSVSPAASPVAAGPPEFLMKGARKPEPPFAFAARIVALDKAVGEVANETIECYPPGVPVIIPGYRITQDHIDYLKSMKASGAHIVASDRSLETARIRVPKDRERDEDAAAAEVHDAARITT